MKSKIKKILPKGLLRIRRKAIEKSRLLSAYYYDYKRFNKYSSTHGFTSDAKLLGQIIKDYHVVEKGLTMPVPRFGFGQTKVIDLSNLCIQYLAKYPTNDQIEHALAVLLEYDQFNKEHKCDIQAEVIAKLDEIKKLSENLKVAASTQMKGSADTYFEHRNDSFNLFSASRKSVRNYSTTKSIPIGDLKAAIELAQNAPSACNRQTSRVYVYTQKEKIAQILKEQNGNRGFGDLVDKLIVITAEQGVFSLAMERNQAYIDAGMYAMNLLYALHYHEISTCMLNCSNTPKIDRALRKATGVTDSESFIGIVACGIPTKEFSIALSKRKADSSFITIE